MTGTSADAAGVAEVAVAEPAGEFRGVAAADQRGGQAARPQLIRALNEQLLLGHIRQLGPCSRAELARLSGLSKPTVSLALANLERSGLIRIAGQRTGVPGRSARLFEISPEAGFVLGLDIGHHYLRGALADLTGEIRAKNSARTGASSVPIPGNSTSAPLEKRTPATSRRVRSSKTRSAASRLRASARAGGVPSRR